MTDLEKTKIKMRPEIEDHEVESVETVHSRGSDYVQDASVSEVREWLWDLLEESMMMENIGDEFEKEYGKNNLVIFSRALEELRNENLVKSWSVKEDGEWNNYWVRNDE